MHLSIILKCENKDSIFNLFFDIVGKQVGNLSFENRQGR
ncbi:MAG: hypothetical protein ACJA1N_002543 [Saprospiraceae bacterium]|jgi:hypothetical protein